MTNNWWNSTSKPAEPLTREMFEKLWDNMKKKPACIMTPRQCLVSDVTYKKMKSGELKYCVACGIKSKVHFND